MSEILKAYALLSSLKENLPKTFDVSREWVDDYHSILDSIEGKTAERLDEFRVSHGELYRPVVSHNTLTGQTQYGKKVVIQRARLLVKVDAVLGYFRFRTMPPEKQAIGFQKS